MGARIFLADIIGWILRRKKADTFHKNGANFPVFISQSGSLNCVYIVPLKVWLPLH